MFTCIKDQGYKNEIDNNKTFIKKKNLTNTYAAQVQIIRLHTLKKAIETHIKNEKMTKKTQQYLTVLSRE